MLSSLHAPNIVVDNPQAVLFTPDTLSIQRIKNEVAVHLLEEWLADESGYDETVWDAVKSTIEKNRLSERRRFDD